MDSPTSNKFSNVTSPAMPKAERKKKILSIFSEFNANRLAQVVTTASA